jgi:hypothetical protein
VRIAHEGQHAAKILSPEVPRWLKVLRGLCVPSGKLSWQPECSALWNTFSRKDGDHASRLDFQSSPRANSPITGQCLKQSRGIAPHSHTKRNVIVIEDTTVYPEDKQYVWLQECETLTIVITIVTKYRQPKFCR